MGKIRNYWEGVSKILYNVNLDYIFNEDLSYKSGFQDIGIVWTPDTSLNISNSNFTNYVCKQIIDLSDTSGIVEDNGSCSVTINKEQLISYLEYNHYQEDNYVIYANVIGFPTQIIYLYYSDSGPDFYSVYMLNFNDVVTINGNYFKYEGRKPFQFNCRKVSIVQKEIPTEYATQAPSEMGQSDSIGFMPNPGTYYYTKELAWEHRPIINDGHDDDPNYYKLLYHPFPYSDTDKDELYRERDEIKNKGLDKATEDELKKLKEINAKLDNFCYEHYYFYMYKRKLNSGDHEGEWWLTNPNKREDTPSYSGIDFCGTTGITKNGEGFNPFLLAIGGTNSMLSTSCKIATYVKINDVYTYFDEIKAILISESEYHINYDADDEFFVEPESTEYAEYEKYIENIQDVFLILTSILNPPKDINIMFHYDQNYSFRYTTDTSGKIHIYLDKGLLGYGRKGLIMAILCRALMNRDYNSGDITDFMEFATNIKNAKWVKCESENLIYPVMSSHVYRYDNLMNLYKVAAAIQTSLGQHPKIEHGYVNLGLPSGTLWATCNVGADTPEDYGDYFAWGEIFTKEYFNEYTYDLKNKYNASNETLELIDDVAYQKWGDKWKIPTETQIQELIDNCTWTWTTINNVNGYRVTGTNGNSIFLPAAGFRYNMELVDVGSKGYYWSSSHDNGDNAARSLLFSSDSYSGHYYFRSYGWSVRPVRRNV